MAYKRMQTGKSLKSRKSNYSVKSKVSDVVNDEPEDEESEDENLETDEADERYTVEDAYNEINKKPMGRFQILHMLA